MCQRSAEPAPHGMVPEILWLQRKRCMDGSLFDSNGIVWFLESHRTTKRWSAGALQK